jgi:hypothetical protein
VRRMFLEDLLLRSTTAIDPVQASVWDYIGALFDRLMPWPLIVVIASALSWRFAHQRLSGDSATLLWCYCLIPLALFTLARTHHSHYIVPLYPAWSILGAVATLEMLQAAQRRQWAGWLAGGLALCVLGCEVRLIMHMEIHDRLRPPQVFLLSLRERLGPGARVHTMFTPSYSERFFLQVADGFVLDDEPPGPNAQSGGLVLLNTSDSAQRALLSSARTVILAQREYYVLVSIVQ